MLAEPFEAFTFSPASASVYQLGSFGTARANIASPCARAAARDKTGTANARRRHRRSVGGIDYVAETLLLGVSRRVCFLHLRRFRSCPCQQRRACRDIRWSRSDETVVPPCPSRSKVRVDGASARRSACDKGRVESVPHQPFQLVRVPPDRPKHIAAEDERAEPVHRTMCVGDPGWQSWSWRPMLA